jgi:hypothetical protein
MAAVSEQTSAAIEEVTASAEELSAQAEEVGEQAQALTAMAGRLLELAGWFKISGQAAGESAQGDLAGADGHEDLRSLIGLSQTSGEPTDTGSLN